jgi:hypothetical protein
MKKPTMAQAYKKAVSSKQPSPEEIDPGMVGPKKPKGKGPKPVMPVAPKSGKSPRVRRSGKEM